MSRVLRGMARDFPRATPSGLLGSCSPGKLRQTSGHLHPRRAVDGRRPITVGGGGGYLLMYSELKSLSSSLEISKSTQDQPDEAEDQKSGGTF